MTKEEQRGYDAAIKALKDMLAGKNQNNNGVSGSSGGMKTPTDPEGNPMQQPELNASDQKKADKKQQGQSQASAGARKEAAQAAGGGKSMGGFVSQDTGAEIAKSEGYSEEDCKTVSESSLKNEWQDAAIEACSKNNSPGLGYFVTQIQDLYLTKHDWKGELKKYIGRALSRLDTDTKIGKRKWLAQDEIKKYDKPGSGDLSDIIFMIDCSGSISDDLLKRLLCECYTIIQRKGIPKVTYVYYDDGVRQIDTTERLKDADKIPGVIVNKMKGNKRPGANGVHGRGGNEESHALEQILKMTEHIHGGKKKELVMWFTDGYTYSTPMRPKEVKNMIWVVYDNTNFKAPDDSRVILIKSEDIGK